jgi:hypothetical protein
MFAAAFESKFKSLLSNTRIKEHRTRGEVKNNSPEIPEEDGHSRRDPNGIPGKRSKNKFKV